MTFSPFSTGGSGEPITQTDVDTVRQDMTGAEAMRRELERLRRERADLYAAIDQERAWRKAAEARLGVLQSAHNARNDRKYVPLDDGKPATPGHRVSTWHESDGSVTIRVEPKE